jgi:hypothetical protein
MQGGSETCFSLSRPLPSIVAVDAGKVHHGLHLVVPRGQLEQAEIFYPPVDESRLCPARGACPAGLEARTNFLAPFVREAYLPTRRQVRGSGQGN